MVGLLKYFTVKRRHEDTDDERMSNGLPDPNGELSKVVPSSSIEVTNGVVRQAREKLQQPRIHFTNSSTKVCHRSKSC